jgi:Fe-S cluster assembly scaffold protein SufB
MARGISKETARKMLVGAFAEDVIDKLANPDLREYIEAEMHRKLS